MKAGTLFSLFYFFFYGYLVIPFSFYPLRLREIGFSATQIGVVSTVANLSMMLGAIFSLQLAHRLSSERRLGYLWGLGTSILLVPLLWFEEFAWIVALMGLAHFTHKGCGILIDAWAVRSAAERGDFHFERTRLWGSIGFLLLSFMTGVLVDLFGTAIIIPLGIIIGAPISLMASRILLTKPTRKKGHERHEEQRRDRGTTSSRPWFFSFLTLLIALALSFGSSAPMSIYLSVYLESIGWSATFISLAWVIAVTAEVFFFQFFKLIEVAFSLTTLFRISALFTALRWLILYEFREPWIIFLSQILHAFSFGGLYLCSVKLAYQILPDDLRDRGQGWLISFGSGLGMLLGRIISTYSAQNLKSFQEASTLFFPAAIASLLGFVVSYGIGWKKQGNIKANSNRR
ncbi:MAG: MFS transporter [Bdellovibrionales bacterium]|nr:MFS transporter [Bdellovibrionales bacterium]